MSFRIILSLLNELRKRDKMRGLSSSLSFFRNELNKLNNIGGRVLESIIFEVPLLTLKAPPMFCSGGQFKI